MTILRDIILLIIGFAVLVQSAKLFVNASVDIAKRLRIPNMVIGLTIVAMGTSAPEAIISVSAAISGSSDLAIANVIGSNIFNLLFIVGFCALIYPISVKLKAISRDYWVSVGATVLLLIMVLFLGDAIPRWGGGIMLAGFFVYMVVVVRKAVKARDGEGETGFTAEDAVVGDVNKMPKPLWKCICLAILGAALIVGGGQLIVTSATSLALAIGITQRIVGLTIVAMGTSLPELVTTLIACRKGEGEFALGFIIGSSIFNIMFVLGLAGLIAPLAIGGSVRYDMFVLTAGTLAFFLFAYSSKRVVRLEGLMMVLMYLGYMVWVVL